MNQFGYILFLSFVVFSTIMMVTTEVQAQTVCVTQWGSCIMGNPPNAPSGQVCYCPTVGGPVWGLTVYMGSYSQPSIPPSRIPQPEEDDPPEPPQSKKRVRQSPRIPQPEEDNSPEPLQPKKKAQQPRIPIDSPGECDAKRFPDLCR
jgi:hypothetical protein